MQKSTLVILRRPMGPKGILWKENYYKDLAGDLDANWLTPIEQRFAKFYPKLADDPWSTATASQDEGKAFIDWTLSQLCRTEWLSTVANKLISQEALFDHISDAMKATLINGIRRGLFEHLKEVYTLPGWRWQCLELETTANLLNVAPLMSPVHSLN
jgi:hypothetical protein